MSYTWQKSREQIYTLYFRVSLFPLSLFAVIFQDLHNCNCLHVLCLMPILHKSLWITDHTMTIIWIIKVIIFLIRSDQQHTMLIGNPRKGLPRLFQLPDWSGLRFTHIDTCPENDRHSFADISLYKLLCRLSRFINCTIMNIFLRFCLLLQLFSHCFFFKNPI